MSSAQTESAATPSSLSQARRYRGSQPTIGTYLANRSMHRLDHASGGANHPERMMRPRLGGTRFPTWHPSPRNSRAPRPQTRPRAERAALGKAARSEVPRSSHGEWAAGGRPRRPGRGARGARPPIAGPRARADPLRAHARLAVHLLPRRRGDHGRRPRGDAGLGAPGAGLRRRPPLQLRRLRRRPTASWSSTSTTSTRRCRGRGSGTSSGSPRASRSPAATAASSDARARARSSLTAARELPRDDARARPSWATSRSGTSALDVARRSASAFAPTAEQEGAQGRSTATSPRRSARTACARFSKLTDAVDGELRIVSDPPLIVPLEELCSGRAAARSPRRGCARSSTAYRETLAAERRAPARRLPLRRRRPQGRRRRQRRHPRLDRPAARPRRGRPALPAGQGGAAVGARALHRAEPSSPTRASASSRASG